MKYVWLIAFLLLILIGFDAAANFVALVLLAGMIFVLISGVTMAVTELFKFHILEAIKWAAVAAFFAWLLSICF